VPKLERLAREHLESAKIRAELARHAEDAREARMMAATGAMAGSMYWGGISRAQGAKFPGGLSRSTGNRIWIHWGLRQNARDIVEDSVHAYAMMKRDADTVIDSGLKIEPTPKFDILGITPEEADEWAMEVHERFTLWAESKDQNRSGQFNFNEITHMVQGSMIRDNDFFLRLYYAQDPKLLNPCQFELIDPNQIRGDAVTSAVLPLPMFNDGIIRDAKGRETAYKIWTLPLDAQSYYEEVEIPRVGEKSRRIFMIHGYHAEYPGQGRGYSQLGITMQEWQEVENYLLAEVKKAIAQSQHPLAVENTQAQPSNFLEQIGRTPAGPQNMMGASTPIPGGVSVAGSFVNEPVAVTQLEEAAFDTPGSSYILNLEKGDQIKMLTSTAPNPQFEAFVDAILTGLLAAHGMPLEWFKQKFEASYSAARGMLAAYWRVVEMKRKWMADNLLNTVYQMWLSCEIAAGRISAPGWGDPILQAAWLSCSWIGTPPVQIDPTKEATGEKLWLELSATTGARVAREHNGSDYRANIARNKKDFPGMPIPYWAEKITVAATSPEESEAKGQGEDEGGEEKSPPGENGKGKKNGQKAELVATEAE
jgi:lambda family phage portal protein